MKKERSLNLTLFGIFLILLGLIAFSAAYKIKTTQSAKLNSQILLINSIQENGESIIKTFKKSDNANYKNISKLFFFNISLLRAEIIAYRNNVLIQNKTRDTFISLSLSLAGLYYIFTGIGIFHLRLNAYARLRIAASLWIITLIITFSKIYISTTSLNSLLERINILELYLPVLAQNEMISAKSSSFFSPILFIALILNMIIYIIIPLWYINRSKIKKYFE